MVHCLDYLLKCIFQMVYSENWRASQRNFEGLHLVYKYDYFDRHLDFESGSISRLSAGFEIYPLSILEIKLQVRKNEIKNLPFAVDLKNEYLLQVHTWF